MSTVDLSGVYLEAPPKPDKYDIIPIHASDRARFKFCRRQWYWSSPAHRNLVPKVTVNGIIFPLWFGTGIHHALEKFYNPIIREDPVVVFNTWFNLQYNGGLCTEADLNEHGLWDRSPAPVNRELIGDDVFKLNPQFTDATIYNIRGLSELLPMPDHEKFEEHLELGRGMLSFYKQYAEANDNFRVIAVEHDFSIPLLDPVTGDLLYMVDYRETPDDWEPNYKAENLYGPLMRGSMHGDARGNRYFEKQVHARGRMDLIIQDNETGMIGIKDYKTAATINDDYFRHLDLDEQVTTYTWAAEQEAKLHGLSYTNIDFIIYEALLKAYPKPPNITQRGYPSLDRTKESTTAPMFEKTIEVLGLQNWYNFDEKAQSYYAWLLDKGDSRFIDRHPVRRNKHQKKSCGDRLYYEALDMLNPDLVMYPNPTKNYACLNCIFRSPCVMMEDGSDAEVVLKDGYQRNHDR